MSHTFVSLRSYDSLVSIIGPSCIIIIYGIHKIIQVNFVIIIIYLPIFYISQAINTRLYNLSSNMENTQISFQFNSLDAITVFQHCLFWSSIHGQIPLVISNSNGLHSVTISIINRIILDHLSFLQMGTKLIFLFIGHVLIVIYY